MGACAAVTGRQKYNMVECAPIRIHSSQFPERIHHDLRQSLRTRRIHHKFHYDTVKQARKWLALHRKYSPYRTDRDCAETYQRAFAALGRLGSAHVRVIGLGCGGGHKDRELLQSLLRSDRQVEYLPLDVSVAMVLTARQTVRPVLRHYGLDPIVCDLQTAGDLPALFGSGDFHGQRLFTFLGMLPNFEPDLILPRLASFLQPSDLLLLSANLAPGKDYAAGVEQVLPLYDNELTRDWLLTFLYDLGIERDDGEIYFAVETTLDPLPLKRITAWYRFLESREVALEEERFQFRAGDSIRLFFSCRHNEENVHAILATQGLCVRNSWLADSGEEGLFLAQKSGRH